MPLIILCAIILAFNLNVMKEKLLPFLFFVLLSVVSCKNETSEKKEIIETQTETVETKKDLTWLDKIEEAHKKSEFLSHDAIALDMVINFGGNERLNGRMTFLTNSTRGKIELNDGTAIYFYGSEVFHSPDLKNEKAVRFDAYTWMYFLLLPSKIGDDGAVLKDLGQLQLNDVAYNAQHLSFKGDVGDAPDDWYVIYSHPETSLIDYAGYIVTANKSLEAAEADPHAIGYEDYKTIDGIPVPHSWKYYEWTKEKGLGKEIGFANLSNVEFVDVDASTFAIPERFIEK